MNDFQTDKYYVYFLKDIVYMDFQRVSVYILAAVLNDIFDFYFLNDCIYITFKWIKMFSCCHLR